MFACARYGVPLALVGGLLAICSVFPGPTMAGAGASTACPPAAASVDATPAPCPWGGPVPSRPRPSRPPPTGSVTGPAGTSGGVPAGTLSTAVPASPAVPSG